VVGCALSLFFRLSSNRLSAYHAVKGALDADFSEAYDYLPYFYSRVFDLSVSSPRLEPLSTLSTLSTLSSHSP